MSRLGKLLIIFIIIQSLNLLLYQYLTATILSSVNGAIRVWIFLLSTALTFFVALTYIRKKEIIELTYFKSIGICLAIFFPTLFINDIYWGELRFTKINVDNLVAIFYFNLIALFLASIVSVFFRKKKFSPFITKLTISVSVFAICSLLVYVILSLALSSDSYHKITKCGLSLVYKDTGKTYKHSSSDRYNIVPYDNLDKSKSYNALIYFNAEYFPGVTQNSSLMSSAVRLGLKKENPKVKHIRLFFNDYTSKGEQDISEYLINNLSEFSGNDIPICLENNCDVRILETKSFETLIRCINQPDLLFRDMGQKNRYIKFQISKNVFESTPALYKLRLQVVLTNGQIIESAYFGRVT